MKLKDKEYTMEDLLDLLEDIEGDFMIHVRTDHEKSDMEMQSREITDKSDGGQDDDGKGSV